MNLLDLMVKVGVEDEASDKIGGISTAAIAKAQVMGQAFYDAAKFVGGKALEMGKALVGGALEGYSAYEQLAGGVAKLYGNANMELDEYARSVGKSMDEVRGEWERNDRAQQAVMQHAQEAYKTAGMSMNSYMEQATGFSAALIKSLGGDTEKAAEITDRAMKAMSDNVNTFGSDAESVQNAIMGISRGNFTMLDNLKLGFSGTKEGAEELVKAANEWGAANGEASDLSVDSFADMIIAIEQVQKAQGIYGTTAREAMTTIEGSVNMTKAAWQNFLTAIGSGDTALIESSITGLVDGIFGTFNEKIGEREGGIIENVIPVIQHVGQAIVGAIPSLASDMAWNLIEVFNDTFGTDFNAEEIISSIERAFGEARDRVTSVLDGLMGAWDSFSSTFDTGAISDAMDSLGSIGERVWGFVESNVLPNLPTLGEILGEVANFMLEVGAAVLKVIDVLSPFLPAVLGAVAAVKGFMAVQGLIAFFTGLGGAITSLITVVTTFGGPIATVAAALGGWPVLIAAVIGAIVAFIASNDEAKQAVMNAWQSFMDFISGIPAWWSGVWNQVTQFARSAVDQLHSMWTDLKNKATTTWNNIKSTISTAMNGAKDAVINAMAALKNGVVNKFNEVVDFVRSIPSRISNAIGDLSGTLRGAGTSLIGGLFSGITSKAEEMFNYVSGIAGKIQALKGPLPYDRKVLIPNGIALMQSLQTGLSEGYKTLVEPYLSTMASQMAVDFGADIPGTARAESVPSIYIGEMVVRDRRDAEYFARKVSQIWTREMNGALA